jgi:hypothetical protein
METRTVHINDLLADGLHWDFQIGQRVHGGMSDMGATVVDGWTEGEFSEAGVITAVPGAEVFYRVLTDDGREFTVRFQELTAV